MKNFQKIFIVLVIAVVAMAAYIPALIQDYMVEISSGSIIGGSTVNKFGQNHSIASGATEDVWDGSINYTFPTTASITHIRSAVNSVITQSSTIEVQGLDVSWALVVQTKDLDATDSTTEIALDTPLIRIFRMKVLENAVMDQDIWAGDADFVVADAKAIIETGNNQTLMAIYTVPAGKTAYITKYYASTTESTGKEPKSTEIRLWTADRDNGYEFQLKHAMGIPKAGSGIEHCFEPYMKVNEKTDIKITGTAIDEIANVAAGFDIILIDN